MMYKSNIKYIFLSFAFFIITLSSCDPCSDCGPNNIYPYFNFSVLNKTALDTLNLNKTRLRSQLAEIDTLIKYEEDAVAKADLREDRAVVTDSINYFNNLIDITNERTISIQSINDSTDLFYSESKKTDSLQSFRIPLQLSVTQSLYEIKITGTDFKDILLVKYNTKDTVINNKITEAVENLEVLTHSFDSLRGPYGCEKDYCISNEQYIYAEI